MALETTFRMLTVKLRRLHGILKAVVLTVGDQPTQRGTVLADELENALLDMMGRLEEARTAAWAAEKAVALPVDIDRARRALAICQEGFHRVETKFAEQLVCYERLRDLNSLGRERGGEWKSWAGSMKNAIEECRAPLEKVRKALAGCWQELVEHAGKTPVSTGVEEKVYAQTNRDTATSSTK